LARVSGLAALLLLWTLVPTPGDAIPPLTDVLARAWQMAWTERLGLDLIASLRRVALGFSIAYAAAALVCLVAVASPVRAMFQLPMELMRPIPPIAWIPLMMIAFGVGDGAAVGIVAIAAFFPVSMTLLAALDAVVPDLVWNVRSLGAKRWDLLRHVYAPSMLPGLIVGARLGLGLGWFSVVAAEMVGTYGGLGSGILMTTLNLDMERFFVYLATIGACGFAMNGTLLGLERMLCSWQPR
jgi:ABC-type nitrate/sulfonate/bicarbonate transport system permease component